MMVGYPRNPQGLGVLEFEVTVGVNSGAMDEEGESRPIAHAPSDKQDAQRSEADAELEQEIRQGRKSTTYKW